MADTLAEIKGIKRLERKIKKLRSKKVLNRVTRKGLRAGAKIVLAQAKMEAVGIVGGDFGSLMADKLAVRTGKQKDGSRIFVGFKKPKVIRKVAGKGVRSANELVYVSTSQGKRSFIPAAIEYGHDIVAATGDRMNEIVGKAKALPWFLLAFESSGKRAKTKAQKIILANVMYELRGGLRNFGK